MAFLRRFLNEERGSSTIEFVILFPALVMIILFIAWASGVISRASNIQEVAHDLARASIRYHDRPNVADICTALRTTELPAAILRSGETLPVSRFNLDCTATRNSPLIGMTKVKVTIGYNVAGDAIGDLGRSFGWNITRIERSSTMLF